MKIHQVTEYLSLRILVGYLGERSQESWWSTAFFEPSSHLFLEPAFPKTFGLTQYHGVKEAACRVHDEHIGIGTVYHLFRLPEEVEQDLYRHLKDAIVKGGLQSPPQDKETALNALATIAGDGSGMNEGPVAIGQIKDIASSISIKALARTYLSAFQSGRKTFPYFGN